MLDEGELLKRVTVVRVHNYYITLFYTKMARTIMAIAHSCTSALLGRITKMYFVK